MFAEFHSILSRQRNRISQLLNVHGVNDVRQTEIHTSEPLVPKPSAFEVKLDIEKLKRRKLPGNDQIPAGLINACGRKTRSEAHKLSNSILYMEELPKEWKESLICSYL
jgi:hypothetical protein